MIAFRPSCQGSLQRPEDGEDAAGQPLTGWVEVDTPWADIRYLNGVETIKAGEITSTAKASVRLWYREDVDASWRFVYKGTVYHIVAVRPDMQNRIHVDLVCEVRK